MPDNRPTVAEIVGEYYHAVDSHEAKSIREKYRDNAAALGYFDALNNFKRRLSGQKDPVRDAAPELLAACKKFMVVRSNYGAAFDDLYGHDEEFGDAMIAMESAIAKAEGKP